jgi:hypothetical protein
VNKAPVVQKKFKLSEKDIIIRELVSEVESLRLQNNNMQISSLELQA